MVSSSQNSTVYHRLPFIPEEKVNCKTEKVECFYSLVPVLEISVSFAFPAIPLECFGLEEIVRLAFLPLTQMLLSS